MRGQCRVTRSWTNSTHLPDRGTRAGFPGRDFLRKRSPLATLALELSESDREEPDSIAGRIGEDGVPPHAGDLGARQQSLPAELLSPAQVCVDVLARNVDGHITRLVPVGQVSEPPLDSSPS